jgi:hypothetical protein
MKVKPGEDDYNILCHYSCGPAFSEDIHIDDNANTTKGSLSVLGRHYGHPKYDENKDEAEAFLAGTSHFQLDEIEVYQKE